MNLIATLCKELGVTTLAIFMSHECNNMSTSHSWHVSRLRLVVLFVFGVLFIHARVSLNGPHVLHQWTCMENDISLLPFGLPKILTTMHTHAWYLYKLVWPAYLNYDYGYNTIPIITSLFDLRNGGTIAAYGSVLALLYFAKNQKLKQISRHDAASSCPLLLLCAFAIFPFVPAANVLFPVGTIVAERLLYFPSVGFCLILGYFLDRSISLSLTARSKRHKTDTTVHYIITQQRSSILLVLFGLIVAIGVWRSILRNREWTDENTLFEASIHVAPWSTKVLSNLGKVLLNSDPSRAAAYLERSLRLVPGYAIGHLNLGLAFMNLNKPLHAMDNLYKSANVDSSLAVRDCHYILYTYVSQDDASRCVYLLAYLLLFLL
jgi:hypothetical protein